jgi:arginase family enzyme
MISQYFKPINPILVSESIGTLGQVIQKNVISFPDIEHARIAIVGVEEGRFSLKNEGTVKASNEIRKELYKLVIHDNFPPTVDLGDIKQGDEFTDTETALTEVVSNLLKDGILPIVLGGSLELSHAHYQSLSALTHNADVSIITPKINLIQDNFVTRIIEAEPDFLFNLNILGFQGHYSSAEHINTLNKMHFNTMRLGYLKTHMTETEPIVRNTDLVLLDVGAVKQADAPANYHSNPNGFTGEEICQLGWYAGVSDHVRTIGLFELNPEFDYRNQTAKLLSQYLWYFIDGFIQRKNDHPKDHEEFVKYRCALDNDPDIVFYKSKRSDRWWMEIQHLTKSEEVLYISCSYKDYQTATSGETPERYWKAIQKLH